MSRKIVVVGAGYWGKNLIRNVGALDCLYGICEQDEAVLSSFMDQFPGTTGRSDLNDFLGDDKVDAVMLASPAEFHCKQARAVLLAGKDVYVEKPLSLSIEDGKSLIRLAEVQNRILMVGHLLQYHPAVNKLQQIVRDGTLGKLQYIYSNRLNLGKVRREENILWSFAPHDISVILSLTGEMPEQVSCNGGNYLHHNIADVTVSNLSFSSGIRSHIFVSWLHPYKEQRLIVVGDKGMAVFDDVEPENKLQLYRHSIEWKDNIPLPNKAEAEAIPYETGEPLRLECEHFIRSITDRTPPRTDGKEGLNVLRVLESCQRALETGAPVSLAEPDAQASDYFVHPSSFVDEPCQIGKGSTIWHFSHIMKDSVLGERCKLGQNVLVSSGVTLGNNVKVQNNVSIYTGVECEDDVFLGPSMVFTNVINPRSAIVRKSEYQPTLVKKGATIGANATILCGITIGEYAFIGAGAVVTKDVAAHALVYGNPARQQGWMGRSGFRLKETGDCTFECPETGEQYFLREGVLSLGQGS
ncbi:MAG: Gfo/Idh/MocA family oxidoreductase [Planctomycetota bacterium]|jgi:UDP-2-acetamido-3-amino-2,3-dideoxy-glucuronate N-acetyltransferase|nr:Gfo/Idh/MocA family oxidoreductase [Planctomycetota bacterium]MDP7248386.1 Gfo/Idh/MocA family oxidoreductase [Planctomycetota bacterium]